MNHDETNKKQQNDVLVTNSSNILVTESDLNQYDVTKMTDFMGVYVQRKVQNLLKYSCEKSISNFTIANIGIINNLIQQGLVISQGNILLVPDFYNLPDDIKDKLKKRIYTIAESKQVDGNLRAVILNEKGVRVKDITLKKVLNNSKNFETITSIVDQMQMKQIHDTLASIQEIQKYQLDRDRDNSIFMPYADALDFIMLGKNEEFTKDKNDYFEKACDKMIEASNAVYTEISTASRHLVKNTKWSLFCRQSTIDTLLFILSNDLQLITIFTGLQMQLFDELGKRKQSICIYNKYQKTMLDYNRKKINEQGMTLFELIHDNYRYSKENIDFWYDFSKELEDKLLCTGNIIENKQIYLVSTEDIDDE